MIYCPDPAMTLPLNVRQAIADQNHSPRQESDYDLEKMDSDPGLHPWMWMVENWNEWDYKDWALDSQWMPE